MIKQSNIITILIYILSILLFLNCTPTSGGKRGGGDTPETGGCTDSDSDGLCDDKEKEIGTDPNKPDSDGDGVDDGDEFAAGTDPEDPDSDDDGYDDYCEHYMSTNALDASSYPESCTGGKTEVDDGALLAACMTYEYQKAQTEFLQENYITKSCDVGEEPENEPNSQSAADFEDANFEEYEDNCDNEINTKSTPEASCQNYGVWEDATLETLKVSITYGCTFRDLLFINEGVLTFKNWDGFYYKREKHHTALGLGFSNDLGGIIGTLADLWDLVSLTNPVGWLMLLLKLHVHKYIRIYDHTVGAPASAGRGCPDKVNNKATVKVNDEEYEWLFPGFLPFRIPEYQDLYPYSSDCIMYETGGDILTYASNNFTSVTHIVSVKNDKVDARHNSGCKEKTVSFELKYYKTIPQDTDGDGEPDSSTYDSSELEDMCKDVL